MKFNDRERLSTKAHFPSRALGAVRAGISTVLVQYYNQVDYCPPDAVEYLYYKYFRAGLACDAPAGDVPRVYHGFATPWTSRRMGGTFAKDALSHLERLRGGGLSRPDMSAVAAAADSPEAQSVRAGGGSTGTTGSRVSSAYVSRWFPLSVSHIIGVAMNLFQRSETRRSKRRPRVCFFA